nr:hypothetical protein [Chloroflexaceae bacterium]
MPPNPPRRSLPRRLWIAVSLMLTGCASLAPLPTTKPQLPPPPPVVTLTRLGGQPLVGAREALTVENIGQAKTLATLGNGALYSAMWNGNGDIIIDTALGLTRYAVPQQLCCDDLGPQLPLRLLAALPGNRLLLAGAYGADAHRPLTVWNMVTNQTSRLPIASARNVVASADGALLALDSEVTVTPAPNALPLAESRLVILDSAGRTLQTFINKPYTQLAFSHDGQRIAIATTEADGPPPTVVVELVDLATGQMVQTLRGFQYVVDD